jgi:hypothetical protein
VSTESPTTHRRHVTWLGLIVAVAVITTDAVDSDTRGAAVPTYAVTVQVASSVGGSISNGDRRCHDGNVPDRGAPIRLHLAARSG